MSKNKKAIRDRIRKKNHKKQVKRNKTRKTILKDKAIKRLNLLKKLQAELLEKYKQEITDKMNENAK